METPLLRWLWKRIDSTISILPFLRKNRTFALSPNISSAFSNLIHVASYMYSSIGTNRLTTGFITPQLFHNRDHKEIWRLCFLLLIYLRLHDSFFILFRITYYRYVIFCTSRWSLLHKSYINTLYHQRRELCNSSDYFHQPLREHYTGKSHSKRLFLPDSAHCGHNHRGFTLLEFGDC